MANVELEVWIRYMNLYYFYDDILFCTQYSVLLCLAYNFLHKYLSINLKIIVREKDLPL